MEKRKIRKKAVEEVDWLSYFVSIKGSCPWSRYHWQKGSIDVVYTSLKDLNYEPQPLHNSVARIYVRPSSSPRLLKKLADRMNKQRGDTEEWLYSHPVYGGESTPVPILIQQNRAILEKARKTINREE